MGYGPVINGKHKPITPWQGSWAQQEQARREGKFAPPLVHSLQWPIGHRPEPAKKPAP